MTHPEEDFIPYGPEWEKAMMRLNKDFIIRMTKSALIERNAFESRNDRLTNALIKVRSMLYSKDPELPGGELVFPMDADFGTILSTIDNALEIQK